MRCINKNKLLLILFIPLLIWFFLFAVRLIDSVFNHNKINNQLYKIEFFIKKSVYKDRSAKVICDNCGFSEIYIKYPYNYGYHFYNNHYFHCLIKAEGGKDVPYCYKVENSNNNSFTILNGFFAHDDKYIYCKSGIIGDFNNQKIYVQPILGNQYKIEDENYKYILHSDGCKKIKIKDL